MKSGLYALASLDGSPPREKDIRLMSLGAAPAIADRGFDGLFVRAVDAEENGRAVSVTVRDDRLTVLVGHLDEPSDLIRALGLSPHASGAEVAAVTFERWGDDAPSALLGEWSMLHWHDLQKRLTLIGSETSRDPVYFATNGRVVAVAPELRLLSKLDWVGDEFDPLGLLLQLSRARLRRTMTGETILRFVRRLVPGTIESFPPDVRRASSMRSPDRPEDWSGSFEDGVAAVEQVLRRVVGQQLNRFSAPSFLLSGGLDSSLLAWLGSEERSATQSVFFLTSVSPEGSRVPDERGFSQAVADQLGLPIRFVSPAQDARVFTPSATIFSHNELPVASLRHYLYEALYKEAIEGGADVVFDGAYGELTVSGHWRPESSPAHPRELLRRARGWLQECRDRLWWPAAAFHARISRHAQSLIPDDWAREWRSSSTFETPPRSGEAWGFRSAARKNAMTSTAVPGGKLRHLMPFRDRRLLRLVASMPSRFLIRDGFDRAIARALLKGRLPESIRLRRSGRPFSPDYLHRLQAQAPETLSRIALFREAGVDEWLDLKWLDAALSDLARGRRAEVMSTTEIQSTVIAAEFFLWWKYGAGDR